MAAASLLSSACLSGLGLLQAAGHRGVASGVRPASCMLHLVVEATSAFAVVAVRTRDRSKEYVLLVAVRYVLPSRLAHPKP